MEFKKHFRYSMTFGRKIGTDGMVTAKQWADFIAAYVSVEWEGFSVTNHWGFWQNQPEESTTVTVVIPCGEDITEKIAGICQAYNRMFSQDCVMVVRDIVGVAFEERR